MELVVGVVLLLGLLVLGGGIAFATALARRGRQRLAEGFEVVPGVQSPAPAEWAGEHSPEARMHRRLAAAVRAGRAQAGAHEGVDALELRVELEQHALATDHRLVAAAALPPGAREPALAEVEASIAVIEQAAADLASRTATTADVRGLEDLRGRISGLDAGDDQPRPGEGQAGTA